MAVQERRVRRGWCANCEREREVALGAGAEPMCPICGTGPLLMMEVDDPGSAPPPSPVLRNEAIFRSINEQLRAQAGELSPTESVEYICECGRLDCDSSVYLTDSQYAKIRSNDAWFFMQVEHEDPDSRMIERHETYVVIERADPGEDGSRAVSLN
jgi:hypothetical protein